MMINYVSTYSDLDMLFSCFQTSYLYLLNYVNDN
jgi:hypothetical protein